tara:strand:+ start:741 stop:917 length:177 start_codon:yes stop_codon:yes gene_type:complete
MFTFACNWLNLRINNIGLYWTFDGIDMLDLQKDRIQAAMDWAFVGAVFEGSIFKNLNM